jgi:uncharacterized protein (TIGR03437 family)
VSHLDTVWTGRRPRVVAAGIWLAAAVTLLGQTAPAPDWRPVGNTLRLLGLPSPAGGPVERLWFSAEGRLHLRLSDGRQFATSDWETWVPSTTEAPAVAAIAPAGRLEEGAPLRRMLTASGWVYAAGQHLYRSADDGRTWENLTEWQGESLLGGRIRDLAPDPGAADRVAVAADTGIWLTHDAGRTWIGLNEGLPNLPVRALIELPENGRRLRVAVASGDATDIVEWIPGQKAGWVRVSEADPRRMLQDRAGAALGRAVTAAAGAGEVLYAGGSDGQIFSTRDRGAEWRVFAIGDARVERFWVDEADNRVALAALRPTGEGRGRVLRTLNGGVWWDDLTADLPAGAVFGLTADRETGAIYAATDRGLYWTVNDLRAPAPATAWKPVAGLPGPAAVRDAALDRAGVRLFVAVEGFGVRVAAAPHRMLRPAAVHTADFGMRPAAPGALMSVFGTGADEAAAGGRPAAVLSSEPGETQLQIPFDVSGDTLRLALTGPPGALDFDLPLRETAPAVLTDRDGTPLLLDAESGMPVDAANPGRPGMVIQILATGLGRVDPDWPAGLPAPLEAPPSVRAPVRVLLDGFDLPVLRATLAPGYIGYYLVEVRLPAFLDTGISALVVDAGGNVSPPAGIHLDQ